jgi:uncharacterized protein (DUF983 family)
MRDFIPFIKNTGYATICPNCGAGVRFDHRVKDECHCDKCDSLYRIKDVDKQHGQVTLEADNSGLTTAKYRHDPGAVFKRAVLFFVIGILVMLVYLLLVHTINDMTAEVEQAEAKLGKVVPEDRIRFGVNLDTELYSKEKEEISKEKSKINMLSNMGWILVLIFMAAFCIGLFFCICSIIYYLALRRGGRRDSAGRHKR